MSFGKEKQWWKMRRNPLFTLNILYTASPVMYCLTKSISTLSIIHRPFLTMRLLKLNLNWFIKTSYQLFCTSLKTNWRSWKVNFKTHDISTTRRVLFVYQCSVRFHQRCYITTTLEIKGDRNKYHTKWIKRTAIILYKKCRYFS